jgi:TonB family protein
VIKADAGAFRACYKKALAENPDTGGKVVIHFQIAADGQVTSASVKESTLEDVNLEECVLHQVRQLVFPAKGGAIVNYPFKFSQSG